MCRRAAERISGPAGVLVLSALHGFVQLDDELLPYEQRMDTPGRVSVERLRAQAAALGILTARDLVALGGRAYVDASPPYGRTPCAPWMDAAASGNSAPASPVCLRPTTRSAWPRTSPPGPRPPAPSSVGTVRPGAQAGQDHPSGTCGQVSRCR
jgi:hypothetical protein